MTIRRARPASGATSTDSITRVSSACEHPLHILVAQRLGHRDHQVRGVTGEAGGVGLVGQPGGQPGHEADGTDPLG